MSQMFNCLVADKIDKLNECDCHSNFKATDNYNLSGIENEFGIYIRNTCKNGTSHEHVNMDQ